MKRRERRMNPKCLGGSVAKEATSTIPIVALMGDPVGSGLVASLAHPGGNLTGLSAQNADLNGKRFELLHEIVPNLRRLAVLFNGNNLAYRLESEIVRAAAIPLGLEVLAAEIRSGDDIVAHLRRDCNEC